MRTQSVPSVDQKNNQKNWSAASLLPKPRAAKSINFKFVRANAGKKIHCKLSLRAAQALGAACRPQKTAFCQISKVLAFLQKEKPKQPTKKRAQ